MNCSASAFLTAIWLALTAISSVVSLPVEGGGYSDPLQSLGYGAPSTSYGPGSSDSGYGNEPANYDFQYEVFGGGNFFGHQESRRDKNTNGKYHVLLPDGRRQIVTYVADATGYHPTITYEDAGAEGGYPSSPSNEGGYGYGAPVADNSLNSQNRYSSRIKRQHFGDKHDEQADVVQVYNQTGQRFRNRQRRFTPKKGYLIVYPSSPSVTHTDKNLANSS